MASHAAKTFEGWAKLQQALHHQLWPSVVKAESTLSQALLILQGGRRTTP